MKMPMLPSWMENLMHLEYFGIRVLDLDRSLRFYSEAWGLKEVKRGTKY